MRVAMYYSNSDVRLEEMPVPQIGSGELLMRIEASGICGSDIMEWYRRDKVPLVLGHEVSGVVVEVGEGVNEFKAGDRVIAAHHVPCNTCHYCLKGDFTVCDTLRRTNFDPGGFAEYVRIPAINADRGTYIVPESVSFAEATFVEPVACVIRGQRRAGLQTGNSVLVLGSGIAGMLHIHLARVSGAGFIMATDVFQNRLDAAREYGANVAVNANDDITARLPECNNGRLADIVIVCTGAEPAVMQALKSVERGGTVLFFAPNESGITLPLSLNDIFWRNDVTLTSSYAGSPADHATALRLISVGGLRVSEMITHRLSLAEAGLGFRMVVNPQEYDSMKVIIEPQR